VLARRQQRRRLRSSTFRPVLPAADRVLIAGLTLCWLICVGDFWLWWLQPAHRLSLLGLVLNSAVLLYVSGYPVFFVVGINRLRNTSGSVTVPLLRVAFVVTRAPSEPWDVAGRPWRRCWTRTIPSPTTSGCVTSGPPTRS
jgi:hypothetical protein